MKKSMYKISIAVLVMAIVFNLMSISFKAVEVGKESESTKTVYIDAGH